MDIELQRIENEIRYKEDELKFVSNKTKPMGVVAGALSYGLGALALLGTRNPSVATQAFSLGAIKGGEQGYDIADTSLKTLEADIVVLKQERDRILRVIQDRKQKLNAK